MGVRCSNSPAASGESKAMKYEFSENNSGGSWWLSKRQYEALFQAGWKLDPKKEEAYGKYESNSLNTKDVPYSWRHSLYFEADSMREAVESWEAATGADFFEEGCNCCGAPFSMSGGDEYLSGNSVERVAVRPW